MFRSLNSRYSGTPDRRRGRTSKLCDRRSEADSSCVRRTRSLTTGNDLSLHQAWHLTLTSASELTRLVLANDRLYCGFENAIEVFDVLNPGEGERIKTTFSRRERGGQKGTGG